MIQSISFPKSMRWSVVESPFARPVKWIMALLGKDPVMFECFGIESSNLSQGHPLISEGMFEVEDTEQFVGECKRRYIILNPEEREKILRQKIDAQARGLGAEALLDPELVKDINNMIEFPHAIVGLFPELYMELGEDVIKTVMTDQLKLIPLKDSGGRLMPKFIAVIDNLPSDPGKIVKGYEKVLKARLEDARFYLKEDRKLSLKQRTEMLKEVNFHEGLGDMYQKVCRIERLSSYLCSLIMPEVEQVVKKAALLCKSDLTTGMVAEFPALQGIVGRDYALREGVISNIANVIAEHYFPKTARDRVPESDAGAIVGISDRIDTICGMFSRGIEPTSSQDPYGLRRDCIATIRIIIEKKYGFELERLVSESLRLLTAQQSLKVEGVSRKVMDFFTERYFFLMSERYGSEFVRAAIKKGVEDIYNTDCKLRTLKRFSIDDPQRFESMLVAFNRAFRIIPKDEKFGNPDTGLFKHETENKLFQSYLSARKRYQSAMNDGNFGDALLSLESLRSPIDKYFDDVLVMTDDESIRRNRLSTLQCIVSLFLDFADFFHL
jgi:glycyl-tRNA synthetase beta chain